MIWQKVTLSKNQVDSGAIEAIRREYEALSRSAGESSDDAAVLIGRYPDQTGAVEIFFSPAAGHIAQGLIDAHLGVPCNPPARAQVEILHGSYAILDQLQRAA